MSPWNSQQLTGIFKDIIYFFLSSGCKICEGVHHHIQKKESVEMVLCSICETQVGLTPNANVLCNSYIKSGELLDMWLISFLSHSGNQVLYMVKHVLRIVSLASEFPLQI